MSIRIGLIGAGVMGTDHAHILAELRGTALVVICDPDAGRARAVADATGAHDVAGDAQATVARGDVDALVVASPDPTHVPLALACIAAAKPVLMEKPLAHGPAECRRVVTAEIAAGRRLVQLGFMRRHDRAYAEMRQALAEGALGRALIMHNFHRNVETPAADFTGAMAITNSAPHEFDIARHVLGCEYAHVSAFQPRRSDALVAPVFMVLETTGGQLVNIEINNNAAYGYDVRAELVGEQGSIATRHPAFTRIDRALAGSTGYDADWRGRYAEAYRRQMHDFLRFAGGGAFAELAADAWDGFAAALAAQAGVRALAEGRRVAVEMPERPEFYADRWEGAQ